MPYPKELKQKAIQLRLKGKSISEICREIPEPCRRTIRIWLKGIPAKGKKTIWKDEYYKKACLLYKKGWRIKQITNELCGPTYAVIGEWVKKAGLTSPEENQRRRIESALRGKNHPNWKGDDYDRERILRKRMTPECKKWRKSVFERDNWTCQECNKRGVVLAAHHIKEWSDYPELRFDINNGKTLCQKCHKNLHFPLKKKIA